MPADDHTFPLVTSASTVVAAKTAWEYVLDTRFLAQALDEGLNELRERGWPVEGEPDDLPGDLIARIDYPGSTESLLRLEGALVQATVSHGHLQVRYAATSVDRLDAADGALRNAVPKVERTPPVKQQVGITFWVSGGTKPHSTRRIMDVPRLEEIAGNYDGATRAELAELSEFRPNTSGRLVIWHGPPGTGKTHAIRALAWEWRKWCSVHYITDPEALFGSQPGYLLQMLAPQHDPWDERPLSDDSRWRLLILEDTGELLGPDARMNAGQGLSRFLNVLDGLIGEGFNLLVLLTTNEDMNSLHPAVTRPGRCAARIAFEPLSMDDANDWLAEAGSDRQVTGEATLAELYALLNGQEPERLERRRRGVGFTS